MKIDSFDLSERVFIVAEAGNNHEGSYTLAEEMVGRAAEAGASAIKFQTIVPEKLVGPRDKERLEQLRKLQLSYADFEKLALVAKREKIIFLSTPFDLESVSFLSPLVAAFKIASGDNNFFPLIQAIARSAKPILLSSGMTDLDQISATKEYIESVWREHRIRQELAILHCVVSYPTRNQDANLLAIRTLQKLGTTVGYSDHTLGVEAAVLAVALGARVIEKHFTLDKNFSSFRDHQLSADPHDFQEMVLKINETVLLLGNGRKQILECEQENSTKARRSITSKFDLKKGHVLSWEDLTWVRPATGLLPGEEDKLVGKEIVRDIKAGENILPDQIK